MKNQKIIDFIEKLEQVIAKPSHSNVNDFIIKFPNIEIGLNPKLQVELANILFSFAKLMSKYEYDIDNENQLNYIFNISSYSGTFISALQREHREMCENQQTSPLKVIKTELVYNENHEITNWKQVDVTNNIMNSIIKQQAVVLVDLY